MAYSIKTLTQLEVFERLVRGNTRGLTDEQVTAAAKYAI